MTDQPQYRIQTVSSATEIPAPTLRVWERRYGVPKPIRAQNSYRLYSDRDIEMIRVMSSLCASGAAPREAARVVLARFGNDNGETEFSHTHDFAHHLIEQILEAAKRSDVREIDKFVQQAMTLGSGYEVYQKVFAPALYEVGEVWARGEGGIAEEHLLTQTILPRLRSMLGLTQPTQSKFRMLLACAAYEAHEGPLLGAALFVAQRGWRATLLGPMTPPEAFETVIQQTSPDAIGLSMTAMSMAAPAALLQNYGAVFAGIPWIAGGQASHVYEGLIKANGGQVMSSFDALDTFMTSVESRF